MSDAPEEPSADRGHERADADHAPDAADGTDAANGTHAADGTNADGESDAASDSNAGEDLDALRREVEEKYDFENFSPADMAEMSYEEWDVAFDPETWITGEELLDRVERDLATRVADRDVFARIERQDEPPRLVAYSDEGYAVVSPDGNVSGEGTVLRDVKPSVALASMDSYEVPEPPENATLPAPEDVPEQSGELGNLMLQIVAGMQVIAALVLFGAGVFTLGDAQSNAWLLFGAGIAFLFVGILLFFTVANARLSDAFRAEEYRNRLRAIGSPDDGPPEFLRSDPTDADGDEQSLVERLEDERGANSRDDAGPDTDETTGDGGPQPER